MRLAGLVFVVVGLIVAGMSWFLIARGQKLHLFLFVGIVMAVFGLWRMLVDQDAPEPRRRQHPSEQTMPAYAAHGNQIPRMCSACGTKNNPRANFCGNCGARL